MHILITGGTGFIGSALCNALIAQGHHLTILSRQTRLNSQAVHFIQNLTTLNSLDLFDAVINLAGEPIFDHRWTATQKERLRRSRIDITETLVQLCQNSQHPPHTFLSGSATGYYGNLPTVKNYYDESSPRATDFAAQLCYEWEQSALQAQNTHTRVCLLRTGMVLDPQGGALKRMLPLYKFGVAGKLGSGKQHWAWISLYDHVQAMLFLLTTSQAQGAFNLVAPTPATNAEFNDLLAKSLHRPAYFSVPEFALKLCLGERTHLLLDNQPLQPKRLLDMGFHFQFTHLSELLR